MIGQVASFDEFVSDVTRPHPGQIEAARNIRHMLRGSKLAVSEEHDVAIQDDVGILRQDRYPLRTSPQWIGPQLESLKLAKKQVEIELNSTTDNPLIDVEGERFLHGGNFQAVSKLAGSQLYNTERLSVHIDGYHSGHGVDEAGSAEFRSPFFQSGFGTPQASLLQYKLHFIWLMRDPNNSCTMNRGLPSCLAGDEPRQAAV